MHLRRRVLQLGGELKLPRELAQLPRQRATRTQATRTMASALLAKWPPSTTPATGAMIEFRANPSARLQT